MKQSNVYGTASNPFPPQGLHFIILLILIIPPLIKPNLINDCLVYSEHVGEYLHVEGSIGDNTVW